jgi:hypothetical protein
MERTRTAVSQLKVKVCQNARVSVRNDKDGGSAGTGLRLRGDKEEKRGKR